MKHPFQIKFYFSYQDIPENWDKLSCLNVFLSRDYLHVLEESKPSNMNCCYIGIYQNEKLVGKALSQFLDLSSIEPYNLKSGFLKCKVRKFLIDKFVSKVLFIGNNMLTGQNAFFFSDDINKVYISDILLDVGYLLKRHYKSIGQKPHITVYKDFDSHLSYTLNTPKFQSFYRFSIQPNMVFNVQDNWSTIDDYVIALTKKYRDQYKRARKKSDGISKRKFSASDIVLYQERINELYLIVAKNAPFNTFYLSENHFYCFKKCLSHNFRFYAYFKNDLLIGFNTLIRNENDFDTYFLGYDDLFQKDHMLYLNMLYDMVGYAIKKNFKTVIFARTALEIKSSVGAVPESMYGFIKHHNPLIQLFISKLFSFFEPNISWNIRNPFK